ncbi:MAG: rhodanese-like domain-containing protein [Gammaproteobacteria bacterium]|nr:rhodanese-like domain-containing protein [Gammaproteobacteria bacterium]
MTAKKALNLTPTELVRRRACGELWRLLDVRELWEIEIARLADAVVIPMQELPARIAEFDTAEPIAVLCHSGRRSAMVADWLIENEFETVANVEGGIAAWSTEIDESIPRY